MKKLLLLLLVSIFLFGCSPNYANDLSGKWGFDSNTKHYMPFPMEFQSDNFAWSLNAYNKINKVMGRYYFQIKSDTLYIYKIYKLTEVKGLKEPISDYWGVVLADNIKYVFSKEFPYAKFKILKLTPMKGLLLDLSNNKRVRIKKI